MRSAIEPISLHLYHSDFIAFASAIGASYRRYGFAVVSDHGLPQELIDGTLDRFKRFFALPEDVKRQYHIAGGGGQRGYTPFGVETAKGACAHDLKEFWHVGRELPVGHPNRAFMPDNIWAQEIEGFREYAYGLYEAMDAFGGKILRAIAQTLGEQPSYFEDKVNLGNSILRVLHYPPVTDAGDHVRAGAHEDINVITILLGAEEAGLQLLDKDGQWLPISPPPGCAVVNIGDMLQRLTNHVLPSTTHRVVNPSPERAAFPRYSMPFFLHFNPDFIIDPLPQCITPDNPQRNAPITALAFLEERLREIKLR